MLRKAFQLILFIAPIALVIAGCGGSSSSSGNDNGVEAIMPGQWSGTAVFGEVEFEVTPDSAGIESFKVIFLDFLCGTVTHGGSITLNFVPEHDIVNRHIDFEIGMGGVQSSDFISIEGTFEESGDIISGSFTLDSNAAVCTGSWVAQPI